MYKIFIKRILDFLISLVAIILLLPLMILIMILVKIKLGSPVIFAQKRPGKNAKIFTLYKFRTMTSKVDENGELLPDNLRLTKFGKFLRGTSLDELPSLFNILIGDMSLVGPRPLLVDYLPLYNDFQNQRHLVKPGLTGLAQVNGRNEISWDEKFTLDIEYVKKISFWLDVKIFFKTIFKVIKREGINQPGEATMEFFVGNKEK